MAMVFSTADGKEPASSSSSLQSSQPCRRFEFPEIQSATQNFDESLVIGRGGFGKVYKGTIIHGSSVVVAAIKRLDSMSDQGADEFWAEVEMLSKLRHCHLVSLIGYCNDGKEMILVYEYMPHGTLEDHLHKIGTPLSWLQRLRVCVGAGRGLDYLHTGTGIEIGVIHRDVKSSNILLHESWAAKISDFGLSKIGPKDQPSTYVKTLVKGTFGYLDPDYFSTGRLTRKSDVYAFGVVLFEVLCRKRAVDRSLDEDQWGLARWAQDSIKEGRLKHTIDSDLRDQISPKCLKEFARIADRCLHGHPKQRPTMAEVVVSLESILALQEKANNSLQPAGKTVFGRMLDMFSFRSKGDISADSKQSSKSTSMFLDTRKVPADSQIPTPSLEVFKFADLRRATKNFSLDMVLGEGSFGRVFLGWVDKKTFAPSSPGVGIAVAIKRRNLESMQGHAEWLAEVSFLGRLAHPNIVSLLGYSSDEHEFLLVYEYMQNRSYDRLLYRDARGLAEPLSWGTRLDIMIGAARGLTYLHSLEDQVIYRDLKCSSILLDQDFNAKLGDFGLARSGPETGISHVSTRVMGTNGYAAPEYVATGHLSVKSDIYGLGVVLLETLTGLRTFDAKRSNELRNLVDWAKPILAKKRRLKEIIDPRLPSFKGAFLFAKLTLRCLAVEPKDRPSSEEVLRSLENISTVDKK